MLYLSQVIGKPVTDAAGEAFDTVADLVIYHGTERFPRITGVLLKGDRSRVAIIPWDEVAEFGASGIRLRVERRLLRRGRCSRRRSSCATTSWTARSWIPTTSRSCA